MLMSSSLGSEITSSPPLSPSTRLDTSNPGNSGERELLLPAQPENTNGVTVPLSSTASLPSPALLWGFKVIFFFIWGSICCKVGWDSVMRMSADLWDLFLYEAFLYYNPLLLVTMAVWLSGVNLWFFAQANVDYARIFHLDQNHLTHRDIWKCAGWMTIIVSTSMTSYLYLYSHGVASLAASQPVFLYAALAAALISPFDIFYLSSRYFLLRTLRRIILQATSFTVFFVADILTSMSKVFSDLELSVCRMVHQQVATSAWLEEADSVCGSHSIAVPIVVVLPYFFRLIQCLRQYRDTQEKTALLNALKYFTAIAFIILSALTYDVSSDKWLSLYWLLIGAFYSFYSFYWDVIEDWGFSCSTQIFKFSRPHIFSGFFHGRRWVYCCVIGIDLILRCTWTYKLSSHLRDNHLTVFTVTALEIARRFQWVFFRVQNEWNKMVSSEGDKLLDSNPDHDT